MTDRARRDGDARSAVRAYRHSDPTTATDRRRIRDARTIARAAFRGVCRDDEEAVRDIFRQEIGTNVRSASPFLLSLVASQGWSIDRLIDRIEPTPRWPRSPALSARPAVLFRQAREPYRRFVIGTAVGDREVIRWRGFGHGTLFMQTGDDWACLEVVDHSLEVEARIGAVKVETLFGVLRIELDHPIPDTLALACMGRSACEVIDHPALHGNRWTITAVEESPWPGLGQALVIDGGSVAFRMPWMR